MKTVAERIAALSVHDPITDCRIWTGRIDRHGYGQIKIGGRNGRPHAAHRVSYETEIGPIPEGLVIDHLCRVRNCVNPSHLEPVSNEENVRRGHKDREVHLRCRNGHARTVANTYRTPAGDRDCRTCHNEACARYRESSRSA